MKHRALSWLLILALLILLVGVVRAETLPQAGEALVHIVLPTHIAGSTEASEALARFEGTGLSAYARLHGQEGAYLLAGADPAGLEKLANAGLSPRVLDADTTGATYYLVYASRTPGRPIPEWAAYGRVLLDDGLQVLVRAMPQDAARLAEAGAELRVLTLDPKPLSSPTWAEATFPRVSEPDPLIQTMLDQVTTGTLYQYVGDLSGEWPVQVSGGSYTIRTRHTTSGEPIEKATRFAGKHLADLGLTVEYHQWGGSTYPNVIGELQGETDPDDIYIICAHLDDMPGGSEAPGADDNASGAAAVLVAADILTQHRWGCTLRFALWTGEEQGLLGSGAYAQRCYNRGERILGVLNLDMIAWDSTGGPDLDLHADQTYVPASMQLAQLFLDVVDAYDLSLVPHVIPNGIGASDHASFWEYGYTALLGIEYWSGSDFNSYYHTTSDKLQYLNMPYFTDFTKASVGTFAHMADCLISTPCEPVHDADFVWWPDPPVTGPVFFTGTTSGTAPIAFAWDFGDGDTGTGEAVSHTYADVGAYKVIMTATNCTDALVTSTYTLVILPKNFHLYLPVAGKE